MLTTTQPAVAPLPRGADQYVEERRSARKEPPHLRGVVFQQSEEGAVDVLAWSGQTRPDVPPDGSPTIPESAVKGNRVVISVDGIGQTWQAHQRQIRYVLHGQGEGGADVDQPVIGIHEGAGPSGVHDVARIGRDLTLTKLLQSGLAATEWVAKKAYTIDPAVKSIHDMVRQCLQVGREVTIMTHSGGGAQAALALSILAREDEGRYRPEITDKVRVLSAASATSRRDFEEAGVADENILYTGSRKDAVYRIFRHHIHPFAWHKNLIPIADAIYSGITHDPNGIAYHSPDYIFAENENQEAGRLQGFLEGGPGGSYPLK